VTTIEALADYIQNVKYNDIPVKVLDLAEDCVLDIIGSAITGYHLTSTKAVQQSTECLSQKGRATQWFSHTGVSAVAAAFANSMAASAADVDDGHRLAAGHAGAGVVPAALAIGEEVGADSTEVLTAIILGYELAVRLAVSRVSQMHPSTASGRWCGFGVAAAGARLRRLSVDETMHALLITEQHSPGLLSADLHGFGGSHVKEGIAWAVVTGILALDLARNGFRGYPETLDKPQLYRGNMITEGLGMQFAFLGTFFKPYACCRWIHPSIDGFRKILDKDDLTASQIREVQIFTFQKAANLENSISPASPEQAQFSIPFILGTVACFGIDNLLPLQTDLIGDQAISTFGSKVKIEVDSDFESCFPKQTISRVVVKSDCGQFEEIVDYPWGDPKNPMARSDLQEKFRILTGNWLTESDQTELMHRTSKLREQTFSDFISLLGKRLSPVKTWPEQ